MENFRLTFFFLFIANFLFGSEYSFNGGIISSSTQLSFNEVRLVEECNLKSKEIVENIFNLKLKNENLKIVFYDSTYEFTKELKVNHKIGGIFEGSTIYFQPINVLRKKTDLKKIILHEFLHFWIEKTSFPIHSFINEGLALYFSEMVVKRSHLLLPEDNFLEASEKNFDSYLFSAREFISYLIHNGLLEKVLEEQNFLKYYRKFYFINSNKIRVLINPRKEKFLKITFNSGKTKVLTREGFIELSGNSFFITMESNKIFLGGKEINAIFFETEKFSLNDRFYRGELLISNEFAVNILPVEYYVYSVISSEMPSREIEALKVQAVLSRTLAYYFINLKKNEPYDVNSLTDSQNYKGISEENSTSLKALIVTQNEVLTFANFIIPVFFSSTCGGRTANTYDVWQKYLPFYKSVDCIFEGETNCEESIHFKWERFLSNDFLYSTGITNLEFIYSSDRVKEVKIDDKTVSFDVFKAMISKKLGWNFIKSNLFSLEKQKDGYLLRGRGLGHGVGVCQYGAINLAKKGKNYREIIDFYFENIEIKNFENQDVWKY